VFLVISVYFNLRNILPKSGTFHLFKDSDLIFTPFLKPSGLELVNVILVSSTHKIGLYFPLRALINHLHKEESIKDVNLILVKYHVL
jgi:hypothetical protein